MQKRSDASLVQRARAGETQAHEALLQRYQGSIYHFVLSRLKVSADADDVAQDVFLAAYQNLEKLEDPERFAGWLFGIARTKVLKHFRSQRRRREGADADLDRFVAPEAPDAHSQEAARQRVVELLEGLEEDSRAVVLLRFRDGLTYKVIAERLGIPPGTVGTILHRARAHFRERCRHKGALG